jgi:uncharacterized protein
MRKIMSDPEIVMSPLCREISEGGTKIQVDIYRGEEESGWILEVIDEENASTVWDDPFDTDQEALDAGRVTGADQEVRSSLSRGAKSEGPVFSTPAFFCVRSGADRAGKLGSGR